MRISFDFDGVLDRTDVQQCARSVMERGHEVYILTARYADPDETNGWGADWNDDLKAIAASLGIPEERWLFVGIGSKGNKAKEHGIELHIDDDMGHVSDVRHYAKAHLFNEHAADDSLERFILLIR